MAVDLHQLVAQDGQRVLEIRHIHRSAAIDDGLEVDRISCGGFGRRDKPLDHGRGEERRDTAVHAEQAASERVLEIGADSVIIATGLVANPDPIEAFRGTGVPVVVVGDANGVGYIEGAIHEGFRAAIEL